MADLGTLLAQQRQQLRESTTRAKSAAADPRQTSGGGGFESAPKKDPSRAHTSPSVEPWRPLGPSTAADMGGAEDTGEPAKVYDQSSLDYLGHFANDNVSKHGHNVVKGIKGNGGAY